MQRLVLAGSLLLAITAVGSTVEDIHAATCTPSSKGTCKACSNCKHCKNCAKDGGTCSVCKKK